MPTPPTFDELYNQGRAEVQSRNDRLTDFSTGSNLDALVGAMSILASEVMGFIAKLFKAQFIDTAEGEDLDAVIMDRYQLPRNAASASVGSVTFTRGSSVGAHLIPADTLIRATVDGEVVEARTDADVTLNAGASTATVTATCTATGRQGNVAAGAFNEVVDTIVGATGLTVTNPVRFAGGSVAESDPAYRDRARRLPLTYRKGVAPALVHSATTVPGIIFASVDESTVPPEEGGFVSVYVGDPDGAGNEQLAELAFTAIDGDSRAAGIEVQVFGAEREEFVLVMTVTVLKGSNTAELTTNIRAAVLAYTDNIPSNGTFYASKAESQAHAVDRSRILGAQVTTPSTQTKVPSDPYKALRVNAEDLQINFLEV